jgi:hypothetical protein
MPPIKPPPDTYNGTLAEWEALTTKQRRNNNPSTIERNLQYRATHKDEVKKTQKAYRIANKEKRAASNKAWVMKNKQKMNATNKAWGIKNKDRRAASNNKSKVKNKDRINASAKQYYEKNKIKIAAQKRAKKCKDGRDWLVANGGVLTEDLME